MASHRAEVLIALCAAAPACFPKPREAEVPTIPQSSDVASRHELYQAYQLSERGGKWERRDGAYVWGGLEKLAAQYPETTEVYVRANTRATVLSTAASLGGGMIGTTLAWSLTATEDNRPSSGAQIALYSIGGALVMGSFIAWTLWHDPASEFAGAYNHALRRELQIGDGAEADSPQSSMVVPCFHRGRSYGSLLDRRSVK